MGEHTVIKEKIVKGLFWKLLENGGAQGIQFIVAIILARLLTTEEYGIVGIISIFIIIANVLVQNGFSTALVQKQKADEKDFSSVFYFGLAAAAVMYGVLFMAAPWIGRFYNNSQLCSLVRGLAIVLFPGSVISVQTAYVSREMEFKGLFKATMAAVVISGAVSIWMAYKGMGAWAMVGQQVSYYFALMIGLFIDVSWKPGWMFSIKRIRIMFGFGWKLLCAAMIDTLFSNLYGLIMGKIYNEQVLGVYNRGEQFPKIIVTNLGAAIQSVLLPAFAKEQESVGQVKAMARKAIQLSSYTVLPMLLGMFAVADTLVLALLGEKWMMCVPFLRIMCIAYCFYPIHITNLQAINAMGRSDVFLKLEIMKKVIGIVGLIAGIQFGAIVMVSIKALVDFLCIFINAWPNKRILNYSIGQQCRDMAPAVALSAVMAAVVYFFGGFVPGAWFRLAVQILVGIGVYILLSAVFRVESFSYLLNAVNKRRGRA
ncbi:MAG: lipopolysaccharide biosynthesis protein [Lachnoclostridium edouardi]|uniref:lipopolysaccharide biosynthesis protein n=1 Tax=Lachnoclostridium edouardi TaxID=1926283 RepID=UPI0026DC4B73|nr:lipopolysaccharide biosynthesis protein [Lachnoclostridium edouardi]MDO4277443.1 lipopolysaccharide biosynthesis protein [Lachnoclostridium edouardi]